MMPKHSRHFGNELSRPRSMFENLDAENRIERAIVEREPTSVIKAIGMRVSQECGRCIEGCFMFDAEVFVHMGPEDALELPVPATDIEQRPGCSRRYILECANQKGPLEIDPIGNRANPAPNH